MREATGDKGQRNILAQLSAGVAGMKPHQISELVVSGLCARWKQRLAPHTYYSYVHGLRRILRQFQSLTGVSHLITALPRVHEPPNRQIVATPQEVQKLWDTANCRERVWLCLTLRLAMRHTDAMNLTPADYDAEKKEIHWQQQKTGRPHVLPVAEDIAEIFDTAPDFGDPTMSFFTRWNGGRKVGTGATRRMWERLKKRANIRSIVTVHDLRRTTASLTMDITKDLRVVQHLLGQHSLSSAARYIVHTDPEKLRPILAQLWTPKTAMKQ